MPLTSLSSPISIPSIHAPVRTKLPTIAGSIPHPYNRPPGCPFHPRCPDAIPGTCDRAEPTLAPVSDGQAASCFLYPGSHADAKPAPPERRGGAS
jgi:oligopeptide/dipeptide ABC transporter ATP-binding protein